MPRTRATERAPKRDDEEHSVVEVVVTSNGLSRFMLAGKSPDRLVSSRILVQTALVSAYLRNARVKVDLVGESNVIQRVHPFDVVGGPVQEFGDYLVARIATQRDPEGNDRLEVFLESQGGIQKAYNVLQPLLQQVLTAALAGNDENGNRSPRISVEFDDNEIATVRLGRG